MSIVCTGSVAVDHIMVFQGRFKDLILPDKIHVLNVAFHVPELRHTFGGCAANIAFNLRLLGEDPIVLATVGAEDFGSYAQWLDRHGIRRDHIVPLAGEATAGAYITTDLDDNQIIGFHPGAMDRAHEAPLSRVEDDVEIGIVSPNGKQAMLDAARDMKARGLRTVVDPGQGLPLFEGEELVEMLDGAELYVVNDYEWELTREKTGLDVADVTARVGALAITLGEQGAVIHRGGEETRIPSVPPRRVVDPTGCGDAWRAGLLHGMRRGLDLVRCAQLGSAMGSFLVEEHGTQSVTVADGEFAERYRAAFGEEP